jgi:hypothetical protein
MLPYGRFNCKSGILAKCGVATGTLPNEFHPLFGIVVTIVKSPAIKADKCYIRQGTLCPFFLGTGHLMRELSCSTIAEVG